MANGDLLEQILRNQMMPAVPYPYASTDDAVSPEVTTGYQQETPQQKAMRLALARTGMAAQPFPSQPINYPTVTPSQEEGTVPLDTRYVRPSMEDTALPQYKRAALDRNPLGIYGPDETSDSPIPGQIKERLAANKKAFDEAKPGQSQVMMPGAGAVGPTRVEAPIKPALEELDAGMVPTKPSPFPDDTRPQGLNDAILGRAAGRATGSGAPQRESSGEPIEAPKPGPPQNIVPPGANAGQRPPVDPNTQLSTAGQQAGMLDGGGGNIFSKIMQGLGQHSNLLLGLGAGLMGAPNLAQGFSRGFAFAAQGNEADIKQAMQTGSQGAMYNALLSAGVPEPMARAGALDKDVGKALLSSHLDPKYELKEIKRKNAWGEEDTDLFAINPHDPSDGYNVKTGEALVPGRTPSGGNKVGIINQQGQFVPATPEQAARVGGAVGGGVGAAPAGGGGTAAAPAAPAAGGGGAPAQPIGGQSEFYAQGINDQNLDWNKSGDDFINQFGPGVKAAVQDRLAGLVPTGRAGGSSGGAINRRIQMIAEKYGRDIGQPDDPTKYNQRNQYATQLANPKSGVGLKKWGFQQATEHLSDITDNLVKMKLTNAPLILGGELTSGEINKLKGLSPDQKALINRNKILVGSLSRELGNMAGGGGVGEAEARAKALGGEFGSGKAAAGGVEGVQELMEGSLKTLERERDDLFPDARYRPQGAEFMGPRQQERFEHIKRNLAILRGEQPEEAPKGSPHGASAPAPGHYKWNPETRTFE